MIDYKMFILLSIFLSQVIFVFLLFLGIVMYANEIETGFSRARRDRAGHYKDLTENGNRARKVSGTQG